MFVKNAIRKSVLALGGTALAVAAMATPAQASDGLADAPRFHGFNNINLDASAGDLPYDTHHTGCINLIGFDNVMSSMRLTHSVQLFDGLACTGANEAFFVADHLNLHTYGWGDRASSFRFVG